MIELTTFGTTGLRRGGVDVRSVLSQPKRLVLLAYLRLATPGGYVARDHVLALFWPEADGERARNALRQSLHFLRKSLGDEVLTTRTEREIGASGEVACDAVRFRAAIANNRLEEALELYRGEFLPGLFIDDAPELEHWLEDQRSAFKGAAREAAASLAEQCEAAGDVAAALAWSRRGLSIDPLDEAAARRAMRLLDAQGERSAALQLYDDIVRRLQLQLELEPAAETRGLAERIREGANVTSGTKGRSGTNGTNGTSGTREAVPPVPSERKRLVPVLGVVVLLTLVGMFAWPRMRGLRTGAADVLPSVAVLPFLNMSGQASNDYFSDGVTEELLNVLAAVPGLRVAARTSSFAFRAKAVGVDSIARALGVTHVLEGSVRTSGDRVRITAQLIEARSGFHVWSETYDRRLDDIFRVQDEIAAAIARKLQLELAGNLWGVSARETDSPEAYRLLLRALHTFRTPSPEHWATSVNLAEEALKLDPGYARAYGALANILSWQAAFGFVPEDAAYARADSLARKGLSIAETPEAHLALARIAEIRAWNPDSADAHYTRALAINPSDARTLQFRALFLARSGRGDEAVASARRATELDPLHPGSWSNYAAVLSMLGREADALTAMEKARAIAPNDVLVLTNLANQYGNVGRVADALATADQALRIDSTNLNLRGLQVHLLFRAQRDAEARLRLRALEKEPAFPRFRLATLYESAGDRERVLALLAESAALREAELSGIRSPDLFVTVRADPRFQKLLRTLENQ